MGYVVSTLSLNCGATICLAIPINASEFKYVHFHVKKGWVWGMKNKLCFIGRHYIIFDQHYYEYDNTDGKDMGNDFVWDTVNMHFGECNLLAGIAQAEIYKLLYIYASDDQTSTQFSNLLPKGKPLFFKLILDIMQDI